MDEDRPDLVRYWFEFELLGQEPESSHGVTLDGGTLAYRLLGRGVGVTGYDQADCLALVQRFLGDDPLPPVVRSIQDVNVSDLGLDPRFLGVAAWRGVWYPASNRGAPGRS